jgi:hypothetical protein
MSEQMEQKGLNKEYLKMIDITVECRQRSKAVMKDRKIKMVGN